MKKDNQLSSLLKELRRDPRLKRIVNKARRQSLKKDAARLENTTDLFLLSLAIASRFVSKKTARALDEFMDIVYFLVQVSLLLKENVFDRPEVKEFFGHGSAKILFLARECADKILAKTHDLSASKLRRA